MRAIEEQERAAYMAGDTERAALLGALIDSEANAEKLQETLFDEQKEADDLRQALKNLIAAIEQADDLEVALTIARGRI